MYLFIFPPLEVKEMIKLHEGGVFYENGKISESASISADSARKNTIAAQILGAHNTSGTIKHLK